VNDPSRFELPKNIERYLASLSKLYGQEGNRLLQGLIVNAQTRVHEEWSGDNFAELYGHALYMTVPEMLFLEAAKQRDEIQQQIKTDLNRLHNVRHEFIEEVFLEMEVSEDGEWRQESGLLVGGTRTVSPEGVERIWDDGFRVFLSHKSEVKREAAQLKERLGLFGVSAFVAHEDIHPTKAWQSEIENALATMDTFVALMTEGFHDSDWTDQEVGFALARGIPVIAVRLGRDPYGFIGKFQALSSGWETAAEEIVKLLINRDRMYSAYIQALRKCPSFDTGNLLARALPGIQRLTAHQIDELVAAYNKNGELRGSFGFNGTKPTYYGRGLIPHLNRLGARQFRFSASGLIEPVP
jgi:hypothetical protein